MERKFDGIIQRRVIFGLIVVVLVCASGFTKVYAQAGTPDFEAKVDSLKQEYMNQGIPEESAEKRARDRVQGEYDYSRLIIPTGGINPNPALGSIAVNRDAKYVAFTPEQLVDSVFVKSSVCSSVSNVTLRTHGWNSATQQWTTPADGTNRGLGYFHRYNALPHIFEFEQGLVLSTGGLRAIEGPNGDAGSGGAAGMIPSAVGPAFNDPDLQILEPRVANNAGAPNGSNVTVLEFDFVPASSVMTFKYIFASEEYLEWANSPFNDVFGFFIHGPGINGGMGFTGNGINIATLPVAGNPFVAINNINWGYVASNYHNSASPAGFIGPPSTSGYTQVPQNPAFYINIPGGYLQAAPAPVLTPTQDSLRLSTEFDGRTIVLTASCTVIPCEIYHLKLAVANTSDNVWQSAVFLEAHSFDIGANLENYGSMNRNQTIIYRGCTENQFAVYRPCTDDALADTTVYLTYSGTCLPNITSPGGLPLPDHVVIPAGLDTVYVPYSVNTVDAGAGHRTFNIHSEVKGVCGGTYTMTIDLYDTSNPDDFQAVATVTCPGTTAGTITVTTGTGGSGAYECSIDSGQTWQEAPRTYISLPPKEIDVYIRDKGGCSYVTRTVSTRYTAFITPADTADLCPPSYQVVLTATGSSVATSHEWSRDGVVIPSATSATYTATTVGKYTVRRYNGTCYSEVSDTTLVTMERCLWAFNDTIVTVGTLPVTIPVLDNDLRSVCPALISAILTLPPSTQGNAVITPGNDSITFMPYPGFTGLSQFVYEIECNGATHSATVYVRVIEFPDNIIESDCWGDPLSFVFTMRESRRMTGGAHIKNTPLVGDLDGDGIPEIVTFSSNAEYNYFRVMNVFDGATGALKKAVTLPASMNNSGWITTAPAVLVDADRNGKGEIILVGANGRLYSYEATGVGSSFDLISKWPSGIAFSNPVGAGPASSLPQPIVTDFNGDGVPELVIYNQIYNAVTGALLGTTEVMTSAYMGRNPSLSGNSGCTFVAAVDMDGDGLPELVAGGAVYKVTISPSGTTATCSILSKNTSVGDGFTGVVDIDLDGVLEVVVAKTNGTNSFVYVWRPDIKGGGAGTFKSYTLTTSTGGATVNHSFPFIGDIDGVTHPVTGLKYPEICIMTPNAVMALSYDPLTDTHSQLWKITSSDGSGGTGITLFDFNNDGAYELVYRDETHLRILDGTNGLDKVTPLPCASGTAWEYPVIADLNGDGSANICVSCYNHTPSPTAYDLVVFSSNSQPWAPARSVWNQAHYNIVNINQDLTVPEYSISPATVFPGADNILNTSDDVRPFNGLLMQQTMLSENGTPLWLLPDVYTDLSLIQTTVSGNALTITVNIVNQGEAAIGPPVYVALYKPSSPQTYNTTDTIATVMLDDQILQGDTGQVIFYIPDITLFPMENFVIRLNDNGVTYPYQAECEYGNNEITIVNPGLYLMMQKHATMFMIPSGSVVHDGFYANPVAALYGDTIEYHISAVNPYLTSKNVIIRDTLPAWLDYLSSNPSTTTYPAGSNRTEIVWSFPTLSSGTVSVSFRTTPQSGVSVSQPLYDNRAWITIRDIVTNFTDTIITTNYTYHQGVGVSLVTFSAGYGGKIFNATEQVLDYRMSPNSGIVIVPDEGYRFAGWSHPAYLSLRGETISAQSGIMRYDTLTVHGDVELHANFDLEVYPIVYQLNGGENDGNNPVTYTIKSGEIILNAPRKEGDTFIGWTGSNGNEPQLTVTIPTRSTGERAYYANFLHSGRRRDFQSKDAPETDRIWAAGNELYVRASKSGSILRVYLENAIIYKQQIILQPGETKYKLPGGFYIVSLNNGVGQVVRIE